jgi:hypothetical protein
MHLDQPRTEEVLSVPLYKAPWSSEETFCSTGVFCSVLLRTGGRVWWIGSRKKLSSSCIGYITITQLLAGPETVLLYAQMVPSPILPRIHSGPSWDKGNFRWSEARPWYCLAVISWESLSIYQWKCYLAIMLRSHVIRSNYSYTSQEKAFKNVISSPFLSTLWGREVE